MHASGMWPHTVMPSGIVSASMPLTHFYLCASVIASHTNTHCRALFQENKYDAEIIIHTGCAVHVIVRVNLHLLMKGGMMTATTTSDYRNDVDLCPQLQSILSKAGGYRTEHRPFYSRYVGNSVDIEVLHDSTGRSSVVLDNTVGVRGNNRMMAVYPNTHTACHNLLSKDVNVLGSPEGSSNQPPAQVLHNNNSVAVSSRQSPNVKKVCNRRTYVCL